MKAKKVGNNSWLVQSKTVPNKWYSVYYKNCGGSCTCLGFQFTRRCIHLKQIKEIVEKEKKVQDRDMFFEEALWYE